MTCEENLGVKGPNKKNKDVGLPMTMPQAAGKNSGHHQRHSSSNAFHLVFIVKKISSS